MVLKYRKINSYPPQRYTVYNRQRDNYLNKQSQQKQTENYNQVRNNIYHRQINNGVNQYRRTTLSYYQRQQYQQNNMYQIVPQKNNRRYNLLFRQTFPILQYKIFNLQYKLNKLKEKLNKYNNKFKYKIYNNTTYLQTQINNLNQTDQNTAKTIGYLEYVLEYLYTHI